MTLEQMSLLSVIPDAQNIITRAKKQSLVEQRTYTRMVYDIHDRT